MRKKKRLIAVIASLLFIVSAVMVNAGEKASQKVVDLTYSKLVAIGKDPIIVKAIQAENAKGKTLAQIQDMDKKWKATPGIADYMQVLMDSECGRYLRSIQNSATYYAEIFAMDNQGANVAMTEKTSDYWQGDEAKFKKSYNNGVGEVFIDEVEFDESTQAYLVQVSIPVLVESKAIGAITFGIDVDKIE